MTSNKKYVIMVLLDRKASSRYKANVEIWSPTKKSKKKLDKVKKYGIMVTLNERSHRPTATKTKVSETPNERATRNRELKERN